MNINTAVKAALNALVDIASHSSSIQPVTGLELAQRQKLSISRIELLLSALRAAGIVKGTKGRNGGYTLLQDPKIVTIKDVVLAMNYIKKRKVEACDIASELYQSLEAYMLSCMANVNLSDAIKEYVPRFSEIKSAPERQTYSYPELKVDKTSRGEVQRVVKTTFKKVEDVPLGPNSIFSFGDYLHKAV
ncbi:MAG: Rrf2 family transcriptional regulator [Polynucleobacter sp.]|jgi:Rrf2 family iron-sulfur cluster assembly transcriptional regulator|uniref:BadM/Rrf2 family transcriptional regulator n=1 Tax=Polynucleobacter aenigmaticus TaxID=1743164 RepID=A0A254Q0C1_9BURK|nr:MULTISPECIES: Rrf2 family transcriptional regulator [Polynucleobacter]MDO8713435.1 Rrf2 family transcriptional regulator [Polynucleobacter sp.]OWS71938.1 BadM/Rrf2 family transcriptional regulator [Polynucleobacter aenigmaticus]